MQFSLKSYIVAVGILVSSIAIALLISWGSPEPSQSSEVASSKSEILDTELSSQVLTSNSADEAVDTSDQFGYQTWLIVALAVMALSTLLATATSFYLYRWRKILLSEPHLVVPEQQGDWMRAIAKNLDILGQEVSTNIGAVKQHGAATQEGVAGLSETFMTLQNALDEREQEIRRLKRGYDNEIYHKFVTRFIRVDQAVEDFQSQGMADENGLDQIRRLLGDAFAECNIECFQPEVGDDYRDSFGVADNPKTTKALQPDDAFKIAEVVESGYMSRSGETNAVIVPAKVIIFAV